MASTSMIHRGLHTQVKSLAVLQTTVFCYDITIRCTIFKVIFLGGTSGLNVVKSVIILKVSLTSQRRRTQQCGYCSSQVLA
jgi:hypothetical protein